MKPYRTFKTQLPCCYGQPVKLPIFGDLVEHNVEVKCRKCGQPFRALVRTIAVGQMRSHIVDWVRSTWPSPRDVRAKNRKEVAA